MSSQRTRPNAGVETAVHHDLPERRRVVTSGKQWNIRSEKMKRRDDGKETTGKEMEEMKRSSQAMKLK